MHTKEHILKEIQKHAKNNNGKPLSSKRFEEETGIKPYDWQKYWARFGDAQTEAGFSPNKFYKTPHDETFLIKQFISLMKELKKWPTKGELIVKHNIDKDFPDDTPYYNHFGTKSAIAEKVLEYAEEHNLQDVVKICNDVIKEQSASSPDKLNTKFGWVYLAKSGPDYKIGKTYDIMRRNQEIGTQLPNGYELIHKIQTIDPDGIEEYWHKRFASKLKRGEWFSLSKNDVNEFKRWRRIT